MLELFLESSIVTIAIQFKKKNRKTLDSVDKLIKAAKQAWPIKGDLMRGKGKQQ